MEETVPVSIHYKLPVMGSIDERQMKLGGLFEGLCMQRLGIETTHRTLSVIEQEIQGSVPAQDFDFIRSLLDDDGFSLTLKP